MKLKFKFYPGSLLRSLFCYPATLPGSPDFKFYRTALTILMFHGTPVAGDIYRFMWKFPADVMFSKSRVKQCWLFIVFFFLLMSEYLKLLGWVTPLNISWWCHWGHLSTHCLLSWVAVTLSRCGACLVAISMQTMSPDRKYQQPQSPSVTLCYLCFLTPQFDNKTYT